MNGMKHIIVTYSVGLIAIVMSLASCNKDERDSLITKQTAAVNLEVTVDGLLTKSFANDGTHNVNRIVVIPFKKVAENLTNDDSNFIPAYSFALQTDVSFPLTKPLILHLPTETTYKVLVIGYNQSDYDFNSRNSPANKFYLGSLSLPTTLTNFHLYPKAAIIVPEFFACVANASIGLIPTPGNTFKPGQGVTLKGSLTRLVSGLSVTITNIPDYVKSISLVAENLVMASKATDASALAVQTIGDGANRVLNKKAPASGTIEFKTYLLPTFDANKTGLYLDVELGSSTQRYTVKVPDSPTVSSNNKLIFNPNHATNITGNYLTSINIGFNINSVINLDDPAWDGVQ